MQIKRKLTLSIVALVKKSFLLVLALVLCLVTYLPSNSFCQNVYQNPIKLTSYNLIFTKVKINGYETLALIDSGAARFIELSASLAQKLSIPLTEDKTKIITGHDGKSLYLKKGQINSIAIGNYETYNLRVEVAEGHIDDISKTVETAFEVILGWEFLSQAYLAIDYKNAILKISNEAIELGKSKFSVNYEVFNYAPIIKAFFNKDEVSLLFDTGAPMCNIDVDYSKATLAEKITKEVDIGENRFALQWRVKDLSVIRKRLGCVGVIGNNFLKNYTVYFDHKAKLIHLY